MKNLIKSEDIIKTYNTEGSIRKTAALLRISEQKVRKHLIDAGVYESDMAAQVRDLYGRGYSTDEMAAALGVSRSAVSGYTPYTKGEYLSDAPSKNALRIRRCRSKKNKEGEE